MLNFFKKKTIKTKRPTFTVTHDKLGTFIGGLFPEEGFISEVNLNGLNFEIEVMCATPQEFKKFEPYLEQLRNHFEDIYDSAQNCAAKHLLSLKNSAWPDSDNNTISKEQFKERMRIGQFIIFENENVEIWFHS